MTGCCACCCGGCTGAANTDPEDNGGGDNVVELVGVGVLEVNPTSPDKSAP